MGRRKEEDYPSEARYVIPHLGKPIAERSDRISVDFADGLAERAERSWMEIRSARIQNRTAS